MPRYNLTPAALEDLRSIAAYLEEEAGERIATRIIQEVLLSFDQLADYPGLGHRRSDLTRRPIHFFTHKPYLIAYRCESTPLIILSVLHGARDVKRILRKRTSE